MNSIYKGIFFTEPKTYFIGNLGRQETKRSRIHVSVLPFETHKIDSASVEARWRASLESAKFIIKGTESVRKT